VTEPVQVHPECEKMHKAGYCVCTMVKCISCDRTHSPHKPGDCIPARDLVLLPKEEKK
jgi:hypothetical protein